MLNRNSSFYMRVRLIVDYDHVFVFEAEDIGNVRIEPKARPLMWLACQLELHLLDMVGVNVGIAECVDKVAGLIAAYLCHHHRQGGVRCYIEGDTQKQVRATLVKLAG